MKQLFSVYKKFPQISHSILSVLIVPLNFNFPLVLSF